jgi:hypothetical protein
MKFYSAFRFCLNLTVLTGMTAVLLAEITTGASLPFITTVGLLAFIIFSFITGGRREPLLVYQQSLWVVLFLFFVMFAEILLTGQSWPLAFAHFLLLVQVVKLATDKTDRDYAQMMVISLMHLGVAGALTEDMSFAPVFIIYMMSATWTLLLFHLKRIAEARGGIGSEARGPRRVIYASARPRRAKAPARAGKYGPASPAPHRFPDNFIGRRFYFSSAALNVVTLMLTLVLFLVFPRTGVGLLRTLRSNRSITGISDSVDLDRKGMISQSTTKVASVRTLKGSGYLTERQWRAYVFSYYDGKKWHGRQLGVEEKYIERPADRGMIYANECDDPFMSKAQYVTRRYREYNSVGADLEQVFVIEPGALGEKRGMEPVIASGDVKKMDYAGIMVPRNMWFYEDGKISRTLPHIQEHRAYLARSVVPSREPGVLNKATCSAAGAGAEYLEMPTAMLSTRGRWERKLRNLAVKWITEAGAKTDYEKVKAIEIALFSKYSYTLDFRRDDPEEEPVTDFLFNRRKGHCELFASAMVLLCRSVDIPARLATGFRGGSWNGIGSYYVIRGKDAHAWVEVYFEEPRDPDTGGRGRTIGWVAFDPTPGGSDDDEPLGLLAGLIDYLRLKWQTNVVSFSLWDQVRFISKARTRFTRIRLWLKAKTEAIKRWFTFGNESNRPFLKYLLYGFIILAGVGCAVFVAYRRRTRMVVTGVSGSSILPFYEDLLRILARAGYRRRSSETPREFARAVLADGGGTLAPVEKITSVYLQARFGGAELTDADMAQVQKERARLGAALRNLKKKK